MMAVEVFPGVSDAHEAARVLSDAIYAVGHSVGASLPSRTVLSSGGVVYDCEMVSVSVLSVGYEIDPMGQCAAYPTVRLEASIVRCANEVMEDAAPDPSLMETDLRIASGDSAVLLSAARSLTDQTGPIPGVSVQFTGPQGGLMATVMQIGVPVWP